MDEACFRPLDWAHLPSDMALGFFLPALADEPMTTLEVGGAGVAAAILDRSGTVLEVNSGWRRVGEIGGNLDPECSRGRSYLDICRAVEGPAAESARKALNGLEHLLEGDVTNVAFGFDCGSYPNRFPSLFLASHPVDVQAAGAVVFQVPLPPRICSESMCFDAERASFLAATRRMLAATRGGFRQPVMVVVEVDVQQDVDIDRLPAAILGPLVLARILATVPEACAVERIGPMRFALCSNVLGGAIGAGTLMHRLRTALTPMILIDDRQVALWPRFGGAVYPDHGLRAVDMLATAERTLRPTGVDSGPWFPLIAPAEDRAQRSRKPPAERAIARGALELRYAPRFDPVRGVLTGLDTSVAPPEGGGRVRPGAVSDTLDLFVEILDLMCSHAALNHWAGGRVSVGLGVAAIHLARHDFSRIVRDCLRDTGVPPELVELQIPEITLRDGNDDLLRRLGPLTDLGVGLALDPFDGQDLCLGTLWRLPVGVVRFADSFCSGRWSPERAQKLEAFATTLTGLGHQIALRGVADLSQLELARKMGCRDVQGPLLGPSVPEVELDLGMAMHEAPAFI